jgi:hypothetical protein
MSKQLLEEAIKAYVLKEDNEEITEKLSDSNLIDFLFEIVDSQHLDRGEEIRVAQVGDRYFRYHTSEYQGIDLSTLAEVVPFQATVTKYRSK